MVAFVGTRSLRYGPDEGRTPSNIDVCADDAQ